MATTALQNFFNLSKNFFKAISIVPRFSKRSFFIFTTTTGVVVLCGAAIYFKRKRKPGFLPPPPTRQNGTKQKKHRRHKSSYTDYTPTGSPTRSTNKKYTRQSSSMSCSSTQSATSSIRSRRKLLKNLDQEAAQKARDLYLQGAGDMRTALEYWKQANALFSASSSVNSSPHSIRSERRIARRRRRSQRKSSEVSRHSIADEKDNAGSTATNSDIEEALFGHEYTFQSEMVGLMEKIENLEISFHETFIGSSGSDTDITITGYNELTLSSDSESAESFVSAREAWDVESISDRVELTLYQEALSQVHEGKVQCRTLRTEILECFSDTEYLAKLYCIRKAFDIMLKDSHVRDWLITCGRKVIEGLLKSTNRSADAFRLSFSRLIDYVSNDDNWVDIEDELNGRKVVRMSFYDIVLDFIIMDSFDDLANPPSSVVSVLNNRWLSDSLKETALSTAVWSVLKAKSQLLRQPDGFISQFYAVSESISPVLAWGFLGTDEKLKQTCMYFKSEVLSFLRGIFNFDTVEYSTASKMSSDILKILKVKMHNILHYFNDNNTPISS